MVSAADHLQKSPVTGQRLSSVVPAKVTGHNKNYELTNMDLAMKLHYIKGVYLFRCEAVEGFSVNDFKASMFTWLEFSFTTSGRIRRSPETSRPFIKCNDSGVRVVEAQCGMTVDEWLLAVDEGHSLDHLLAYDQVLGPDLGFSPLVFVQFTWFKCGGISIGLSWAHVLGDAFSASTFINLLGQILAAKNPSKSVHVPNPKKTKFPVSFPGKRKPLSLKKVDSVGDCWNITNNNNMQTYSFHVNARQLHQIVSCTLNPSQKENISDFEILCALIWQSLHKIKGNPEPMVVTICRNNSAIRGNGIPTNGMMLSTVEADFSELNCGVVELAKLIAEKKIHENAMIEDFLEGEEGKSDFIVYGANLTFVDLGEAKFYELKLKGQKPVFVNYAINGVGDEGNVLILPGPGKENASGKIVTMTLPEDQIQKLKNLLKKDWNLTTEI